MKIQKFKNKPKILLIQGSPRVVDNCPNMESKTFFIVKHIIKKYNFLIDFEIVDLALEQNKSIVQPCKSCISTAGGYHCHWSCLPSSERIQTDKTYVNINDIKENDILSTGKVKRQWLTSELESVYELILTDGRKIRCTDNHLIKTLSKERFRNDESDWKYFRKENWTQLKDIKIGDFIPEIILGGKFSNETIFPKEYFLLLGLYWGDGTNAGKDSLMIYYDDKTEHDFGQAIKSELNFHISDLPHKAKTIFRENSVNNSEMKKINYGEKIGRIINYDMNCKKTQPANERKIPKLLFNCSEEELCLFFNGWFSTDGSVSKSRTLISLSNISYDCLRDAQLLLAKIGIKSSVSDNSHLIMTIKGKEYPRASTLNIIGYNNIKIFKEKIGFLNENKSIKLDNLLTYKIKKMKNKPAKVKSIRYIGKEPVYDISVNSHEFVAEGILVHNCDCYNYESGDLMYDQDVYKKLEWCDAFVVFTPIHWYSVTSQLKALFDRLVCANLTLSAEDAKRILGDDIKNSEVTGKLSTMGAYNNLIKNHLEGKYGAFFVHGDAGAADYKDREYPDSYSKVEESLFDSDAKVAIKPIVFQCRYSGINVPDDLIEAFYMNMGLDYYTSNTTLDKNRLPFEKSEQLIERLIQYI
jgi:multimeric flavodoxin WrbA